MDEIQKKINDTPKDTNDINPNMNNDNNKGMELNPVIPPYQGYHNYNYKLQQQRQSYDQRPSFMRPLFQPSQNKNKNMEYHPPYNIISPRRDIGNPPAYHDPRWNRVQVPKLPPIPIPRPSIENNNIPHFIEQPRKHPPVSINPRFKKMGIR